MSISYQSSCEALSRSSGKRSYFYLILSTGFAMFSMFFGSGNLVFPLIIGKVVDAHYVYASLGLFLTGVCVPFLGLLGIILFQGDYEKFFGRLGVYASLFMPLIMLLLLGPFGVVPRCITVAYGSFALIFPQVNLLVFSALSCGLLFFLTIDKHKIVNLLGVFLTPFLLLSLAVIIGYGILYSHITATLSTQPLFAFSHGLVQGYQTMDLLAAFFFASAIIEHLKRRLPCQEPMHNVLKLTLSSGILGAVILGAIYFAFVYLGAAYATHLDNINVEQALGIIASHTLGVYAAPIVCLAVVLACLTTAVILTSVFAEFFREKITRNKIPLSGAILITLGCSFFISTFQFNGIAAFLSPLLKALYPGLILMTILNIAHRLFGFKMIKTPVYLAFGAAALGMMLF